MGSEELLFIRIVAAVVFIAILLSGIYVAKNYQKLFGADPDVPSENPSARAYGKVQVFTVWLIALLLAGAFVLLLH